MNIKEGINSPKDGASELPRLKAHPVSTCAFFAEASVFFQDSGCSTVAAQGIQRNNGR